MAIAFVTNTNSALTSEATESFSYTMSGTNPVLYVHIGADSGVSAITVKYGGQDLALGRREAGSGGDRWIEVWYTLTPLGGSNTVAVTLSGACSGGITASHWTGVASLRSWTSNASTGTTSIDVTSAVGDTAVDFKQISGGGAITPGGSQTLVYDYDLGAGTERLYCSKIPGGSPTVTMSWSDGGQYTNHVGVSMTPFDYASLILRGVGQAG